MIKLSKSPRSDKKYMVYIDGFKIHFGAAGYSDYTQHKDPARKARYITRHKTREDWADPYTAGFWSRWLLWNKPTIEESKKDMYQRFKLRILD